jgi:hypothetical protein
MFRNSYKLSNSYKSFQAFSYRKTNENFSEEKKNFTKL